MNPMLRKLVNVVIIMTVIVGFVYQVWEIGNDYFKYPTITSVTIVDVLPATNIPQIAVCSAAGKPNRDTFVDAFQKQLMEQPGDGSYPGGDPTLVPGSLSVPIESLTLNDSEV